MGRKLDEQNLKLSMPWRWDGREFLESNLGNFPKKILKKKHSNILYNKPHFWKIDIMTLLWNKLQKSAVTLQNLPKILSFSSFLSIKEITNYFWNNYVDDRAMMMWHPVPPS